MSLESLASDDQPGKQSWSDQAHSLLEQGEYGAALEYFRQAVQTAPLADDYVSQAVCLIHLDRPQEALEMCDRALSLNSGHSRAWLFRGVALHRLGQFDEAYACYDLA
ncbi:MAG: tetratricopeptide repeat protein, partial [Leptolyngbya sp. SIO1D8]|nr:tetratricopeptide repeat protein [Leptolyngbya sp. SIO1D8]